jgi:hypothetical protein
MAKGQSFYPVQCSGFMWMGNHYHIIISGTTKHISSFIGYIQAELHITNSSPPCNRDLRQSVTEFFATL